MRGLTRAALGNGLALTRGAGLWYACPVQRILDVLAKLQIPAAMILVGILAADMAGAFDLPVQIELALAIAAAGLGVPRPKELASDWAKAGELDDEGE